MNLFSLDTSSTPLVRVIGHVAYQAPWAHFVRTSDEFILFVLKSGEMYLQEEETRYALKRSDCLLLEPGLRHFGYQKSVCHYFFIHFCHTGLSRIHITQEQYIHDAGEYRKRSLASDCFSEKAANVCPPVFFPKKYTLMNPGEILEPLEMANHDFYSRYECYKQYTSWKFAEILLKISREFLTASISQSYPRYSKTHTKVSGIIQFLESHYADKITSRQVEERFESSYDYLNRIFQKVTGKPIFHYLNEIRISQAKELIRATPMKFEEIAYLVGVNDPYYFSRLFKKVTGITPSMYANEFSKENTDF